MTENRQQIETALRASFIFSVLPPAERERFIASARRQSWGAGATIFSMGDPGDSMVLVESGEVRISYPAPGWPGRAAQRTCGRRRVWRNRPA